MAKGQVLSLLVIGGAVYAIYTLVKPRKPFDVKGKVIWITGASSGIGEALAITLYEKGAKLIISSRDVARLKHVADHLVGDSVAKETTYPMVVLPLDLNDTDTLTDKAKEALAIHGYIDMLINNGGISLRSRAIDTQLEVDKRMMNINYLSYVVLSKAVLPSMIARRYGFIVNMSSIQGFVSIPFRASYAASKHALHGYFNSLRYEVADDNIHIMDVCPSYVRTNLSRNAMTGDGSKHGIMDSRTEKGFTPQYVVQQLLYGLEEKATTLLISDFKSTLAVYIGNICPSILQMVLRRRVQKRGAADN